MRRFFFAMVFTPSRGYMNPTVISVSVRDCSRQSVEKEKNYFIGTDPTIIFKPAKSIESHLYLE